MSRAPTDHGPGSAAGGPDAQDPGRAAGRPAAQRGGARPPGPGHEAARDRAAAALSPLVTEIVDRTGFVLDDLEVRPVGRSTVVRITLDTAEVPGADDGPTGGVDLDALAVTSRELSAALDAHEDSTGAVLDGAYTLEVSTPGTDRPLTRPHHWRRAWLRRVVVALTDGSEVTGRVGGLDSDGTTVTLAVPTKKVPELRTLALADVARAVVEVEFKPAPDAEVELLRGARADAGTDATTHATTDPTHTTGTTTPTTTSQDEEGTS